MSPRGGGGSGACSRTCTEPRSTSVPGAAEALTSFPLWSALLLFATCLGLKTVFHVHRFVFLFETLKKKNPFISNWWPRLTVLRWDTYSAIYF